MHQHYVIFGLPISVHASFFDAGRGKPRNMEVDIDDTRTHQVPNDISMTHDPKRSKMEIYIVISVFLDLS